MERRPNTQPDSGSRTLTQTGAPPQEGNAGGPSEPITGVLKLRGGPSRRQKVVWREDTIDNEGMGKKKSKICCIYHKPKAYDQSSDESSNDSDCGHDHAKAKAKVPTKRKDDAPVQEESSESEGGGGDGKARPPKKKPPKKGGISNDPAKANKYDHQNGN